MREFTPLCRSYLCLSPNLGDLHWCVPLITHSEKSQ